MDRRRPTSQPSRRSTSGSTRGSATRRSSQSSSDGRGRSQKQGFSPKIAVIIAAIAVALICTPLLLLAFTAESPEDQLENLYNTTAEELGMTAATAKVAVLDVTVPETTVDPDAFVPSGDYLYEEGMTDDAMHSIQARLMEYGYMLTAETTDYFGPATKDAIELLQTRYGLAITGGIDQQTYDQLFSDSIQKYAVTVGVSGSDVAQIQTLLRKLGYFTGSSTGYYGSETANAVKKFQLANGLEADGAVGIGTLQKLKSSGAIAYVPPSPTPTPTPGAAVTPEGGGTPPAEAPTETPAEAPTAVPEESAEPGMP